MRIFVLFSLVFTTVNALSAVVPVNKFDQAKLANLLIRIPAAHFKDEQIGDFVRKHYLYPEGGVGVVFSCSADFFPGGKVPSASRCKVDVKDTETSEVSVRSSGDEYAVEIKDKNLANVFFQHIGHGLSQKNFHSTERVLGQSFGGVQRKLFRYMLSCTKTACKMSFASKAAI